MAVAFGASLVSTAAAEPPKNGGGAPETVETAVPGEDAIATRLRAFLATAREGGDRFSGQVLVARNGEVLLHEAAGLSDAADGVFMTRENMMDCASIGKQFTAAAVLRLCEQGALELDTTLGEIYPGAPENKKNVTVRMLLTHTSGVSNDGDFRGVDVFDRDAVVRYILSLPVRNEPGSKWEYSNIGYFLLAAIVEERSGESFEAYLRREVFERAGLKTPRSIGEADLEAERVPKGNNGRGARFSYGPRLSWGYRGAGGVLVRAEDLHAWDMALRGDGVLSEQSLREMFTPTVGSYGLGWQLSRDANGRRWAEHGGSVAGFASYFLRCLDEEICIVVLLNNPSCPPRMLATDLLAIVEGGYVPPGVDGDRPLPLWAEGTWRTHEGRELVIRFAEGKATVTFRGPDGQGADCTFIGAGPGWIASETGISGPTSWMRYRLRFQRDENGDEVGEIWLGGSRSELLRAADAEVKPRGEPGPHAEPGKLP